MCYLSVYNNPSMAPVCNMRSKALSDMVLAFLASINLPYHLRIPTSHLALPSGPSQSQALSCLQAFAYALCFSLHLEHSSLILFACLTDTHSFLSPPNPSLRECSSFHPHTSVSTLSYQLSHCLATIFFFAGHLP